MKRMSPWSTGVLRALAAAAAFAIVASACGGGGDPSSDVASLSGDVTITRPIAEAVEDSSGSPEEALLAFASCMRENGLDVADPTVDAEGNLSLGRPGGGGGGAGAGFDRQAAEAAFEVCGDLLEGVTLGFGAQDRTGLEDDLLSFASCMRDNGFDMPDPDFSATPGGAGGPGGGGPFGQIDRDDPAFESALETCQDELPGFAGGGGGGGGRFRGGGGGGNG